MKVLYRIIARVKRSSSNNNLTMPTFCMILRYTGMLLDTTSHDSLSNRSSFNESLSLLVHDGTVYCDLGGANTYKRCFRLQLEIDNGIAKFTHSSIILSWLVLVVGRQQVVFWKAESKLYRLVVVSRPNIDSLSIDLTKSTPTI